MITIANDQLPQTKLAYLAFRIAFLETLDRVTWTLQFDSLKDERFGFLTEVPFLKAVAPHIQLDLLLETWQKHASEEIHEASLVDESVVYACCETSARIVEEDSDLAYRLIQEGPQEIKLTVDHHLAAELRNLHLSLANEGDFLLIGQFADLSPDDAISLKKKFSFNQERAEAMFEILGRWRLSGPFEDRGHGLITAREQAKAWEIVNRSMSNVRT